MSIFFLQVATSGWFIAMVSTTVETGTFQFLKIKFKSNRTFELTGQFLDSNCSKD